MRTMLPLRPKTAPCRVNRLNKDQDGKGAEPFYVVWVRNYAPISKGKLFYRLVIHFRVSKYFVDWLYISGTLNNL